MPSSNVDLTELKAATEQLNNAEEQAKQARQNRDNAIRDALNAGAKVLQVQITTGLSVARISHIRHNN